tara:strand:+ start:3294 stop:3776 length:483 start_codon:yes stop_codon:yes gene_type:complete
MYVKVVNNSVDTFPYTLRQLKIDNPKTSFPKTIYKPEGNDVLASFNIYPVTQEDIPSHNYRTQYVEQNSKPVLSDGSWTVGWTVSNKTSKQIAEHDADIAETNRGIRNNLLSDTDWTQMNDSPLSNEDKTAWATYRQELRGITDLDEWPNLADDDWPVEP